ncbi:restriction endonuclease [Arcobacter porcinus]|uniref:restriction endonuclease n=1 Tax=Arcobacter porcinus TaxID=1935204 RepID=UPI0008253C3D|nr:restriction endonuclease [Arcobacter porcinus]OCL86269.1 hypothetical protein AAX30_01613 [Arcobacter porcinus]
MLDWLTSLSIKQIVIIVAVILILVIPRRILFGLVFLGILISYIYYNIDFAKYILIYKSELVMFFMILVFVLIFVKIKTIYYEMKIADEKIKNKKYDEEIIKLESKIKELRNNISLIENKEINLKNVETRLLSEKSKNKRLDQKIKVLEDNLKLNINKENQVSNDKSKLDLENYSYRLKIKELEKTLSMTQTELIKKNILIDDEKVNLEKEIKELQKRLPKIYTKDEIDNMKKYGDDFEKYVGKSYEEKGYEVEYRGLDLGFLDKGIDLIARKPNEILLIQCKFWKKKDSITHNMVKEFYGNCNFYIDNNNLDRKVVTCIYAVAKQDSISSLAYELFKANYINCRYELYGC